jgi:hypothetical protein
MSGQHKATLSHFATVHEYKAYCKGYEESEKELAAARARIAELEFNIAQYDTQLGKRPCKNSRCNELNAARALLQEVSTATIGELQSTIPRIRSFLEGK